MILSNHGVIQSGKVIGGATDPHAANVVLFLKSDQSSLVTNTTTTANFTVPAVNSTVTINVVSSAWAASNRAIRIGNGAGNYIISLVPNSTQITVRNCGGSDNATAGTVITSGATIALSIIDSSPNPKIISAFGNAQLSATQSRYLFDGNTDAIEVESMDIAQDTSATIEAYISLASVTPNQGLFSKFLFNGGFTGWGLRCSNGSIQVFNNNTNPFIQTPAILQPNTLTHIALSKENTTIKVFIDGIKQGEATQTLAVTSNNFLLGSMYNNSLVESANGFMSLIRITKPVRYTTNFNPETDTYLNV